MSTKWKTIVAIAAIAVIVAVAVVLINRPPEQAAQPEPSEETGMVAGKLGFPVSKINIGEGGTKTASDGKTITGYNGTCDSAAQAAANYTHLVEDVNVSTWAQQKKTLAEVGKPGDWTDKITSKGDLLTTSKDLSDLSFDGGWLYRSDVAAGGLYRLASCEPKKTAVVQVFFGATSANIKAAPSAFFQTATFELVWDGDWKVSDAAVVANGQDFGGKVKDSGPMSTGTNMDGEASPVLRNDLVNAFFKDITREGWVEYANAKR
jgi:hypothetical protein